MPPPSVNPPAPSATTAGRPSRLVAMPTETLAPALPDSKGAGPTAPFSSTVPLRILNKGPDYFRKQVLGPTPLSQQFSAVRCYTKLCCFSPQSQSVRRCKCRVKAELRSACSQLHSTFLNLVSLGPLTIRAGSISALGHGRSVSVSTEEVAQTGGYTQYKKTDVKSTRSS